MSNVQFVIANNYQQFRDYLHRNDLRPRDFCYIGTCPGLYGIHGEVLVVGDMEPNPVRDLAEELQQAGYITLKVV